MLGQVPYAIAKDELFPGIFARLNKKGVPQLGMVISCTVISALMIMNYTKGLVDQFKFLLLLSYIGYFSALFAFDRRLYYIAAQRRTLHKGSLAGVFLLACRHSSILYGRSYGTGEKS